MLQLDSILLDPQWDLLQFQPVHCSFPNSQLFITTLITTLVSPCMELQKCCQITVLLLRKEMEIGFYRKDILYHIPPWYHKPSTLNLLLLLKQGGHIFLGKIGTALFVLFQSGSDFQAYIVKLKNLLFPSLVQDGVTSCDFSLNSSFFINITKNSSGDIYNLNENSSYIIMAVGEYDKSQHLITGHTMRNKTDSKLDISDHNKFYNKNNTGHNETGIARIIFYTNIASRP